MNHITGLSENQTDYLEHMMVHANIKRTFSLTQIADKLVCNVADTRNNSLEASEQTKLHEQSGLHSAD